ncbi:MAG: serine/threonine protein kinase [Chitinivorax sp.]
MSQSHPYDALTPDVILDAVDSAGFHCDGGLTALNSFENRVYQLGQDDGPPLIAKFYRPARWSDAAILEEHAFSGELAEREIPVVAPLNLPDGSTLGLFRDFRFAVYPRRAGRTPELDDTDTLEWLGRFLGRIHAVGAVTAFQSRPTLDIASFGDESVALLRQRQCLPADLEAAYFSVVEQVLTLIRQRWQEAGNVAKLRLHGDCHPGNILWTDAGPHFVDFDDCRMGPAVQDLWMLLSGERREQQNQLGYLIDGYSEFADFDERELSLIEPLRTLRMLHYSAWLARRWDDPAFPANFPWFNSQRYWQDQILALREQQAALQEAPLRI